MQENSKKIILQRVDFLGCTLEQSILLIKKSEFCQVKKKEFFRF